MDQKSILCHHCKLAYYSSPWLNNRDSKVEARDADLEKGAFAASNIPFHPVQVSTCTPTQLGLSLAKRKMGTLVAILSGAHDIALPMQLFKVSEICSNEDIIMKH